MRSIAPTISSIVFLSHSQHGPETDEQYNNLKLRLCCCSYMMEMFLLRVPIETSLFHHSNCKFNYVCGDQRKTVIQMLVGLELLFIFLFFNDVLMLMGFFLIAGIYMRQNTEMKMWWNCK